MISKVKINVRNSSEMFLYIRQPSVNYLKTFMHFYQVCLCAHVFKCGQMNRTEAYKTIVSFLYIVFSVMVGFSMGCSIAVHLREHYITHTNKSWHYGYWDGVSDEPATTLVHHLSSHCAMTFIVCVGCTHWALICR